MKLYRMNVEKKDGHIYYTKIVDFECDEATFNYVHDQFLIHDKPICIVSFNDEKIIAILSSNYHYLASFSAGIRFEYEIKQDFEACLKEGIG